VCLDKVKRDTKEKREKKRISTKTKKGPSQGGGDWFATKEVAEGAP